jgi:hypothetical protein
MNSEEKTEFCQKNNIDPLLLVSNCPCAKDENGIAIFPRTESQNELQITVQQLTAHLAKMTEQLNALTNKLNS